MCHAFPQGVPFCHCACFCNAEYQSMAVLQLVLVEPPAANSRKGEPSQPIVRPCATYDKPACCVAVMKLLRPSMPVILLQLMKPY